MTESYTWSAILTFLNNKWKQSSVYCTSDLIRSESMCLFQKNRSSACMVRWKYRKRLAWAHAMFPELPSILTNTHEGMPNSQMNEALKVHVQTKLFTRQCPCGWETKPLRNTVRPLPELTTLSHMYALVDKNTYVHRAKTSSLLRERNEGSTEQCWYSAKENSVVTTQQVN